MSLIQAAYTYVQVLSQVLGIILRTRTLLRTEPSPHSSNTEMEIWVESLKETRMCHKLKTLAAKEVNTASTAMLWLTVYHSCKECVHSFLSIQIR